MESPHGFRVMQPYVFHLNLLYFMLVLISVTQYGYLIGTSCLCAILEMGLAFVKPATLKKIFPPIVTGPVVRHNLSA